MTLLHKNSKKKTITLTKQKSKENTKYWDKENIENEQLAVPPVQITVPEVARMMKDDVMSTHFGQTGQTYEHALPNYRSSWQNTNYPPLNFSGFSIPTDAELSASNYNSYSNTTMNGEPNESLHVRFAEEVDRLEYSVQPSFDEFEQTIYGDNQYFTQVEDQSELDNSDTQYEQHQQYQEYQHQQQYQQQSQHQIDNLQSSNFIEVEEGGNDTQSADVPDYHTLFLHKESLVDVPTVQPNSPADPRPSFQQSPIPSQYQTHSPIAAQSTPSHKTSNHSLFPPYSPIQSTTEFFESKQVRFTITTLMLMKFCVVIATS